MFQIFMGYFSVYLRLLVLLLCGHEGGSVPEYQAYSGGEETQDRRERGRES